MSRFSTSTVAPSTVAPSTVALSTVALSTVEPGAGPSDRIELRALRLVGAHGVLDEEKNRAQPFEVDLDIYTDLAPSASTDLLGHTVDYGAVTAAIAAVVAGPHVDLLESLANRIIEATFEVGGNAVSAVSVRVAKLRPPVPFDLGCSAVRMTRQRNL